MWEYKVESAFKGREYQSDWEPVNMATTMHGSTIYVLLRRWVEVAG